MPGRTYTAEFKRDALAERDSVAQAAKILGITENNSYRWRREAREQGEDAFRGKVVMTAEQAELARLRRELANAKDESIFLRAGHFLPEEMIARYAWIQAHQGHHSVERMAETLDVTRSGYYAWRKSPQSPRQRENEQLKEVIAVTFEASRKTYGSPRVTQALRQDGRAVGLNRVARLMREMELKAHPKKRWKDTTQSKHRHPIAENNLARDFKATRPDEKWIGDITYILTKDGGLYPAVVLDLHSRKGVGWSMNKEMKTELVLDALNMTVVDGRPSAGLLFHSDRGVQYAIEAFRARLKQLRFQQSMSRKGSC